MSVIWIEARTKDDEKRPQVISAEYVQLYEQAERPSGTMKFIRAV